jgi:hypothetical protein
MSSRQQYQYSPIIYRYDPRRFIYAKQEVANADDHQMSRRSSPINPRANRNTWFRVATYQHYKPVGTDENANGDHPMRWGR